MSLSLPVPFLHLPATVGQAFPPQARALLDSGAVLAFRAVVEDNGRGGRQALPGIHVAIPHEVEGVVWMHDPSDIIAQDRTTPGLMEACFVLAQTLEKAFSPYDMIHAWKTYKPCDGESVYADVIALASGFAVGETDPGSAMEYQFEELAADLEEGEPSTEFETGRFVAIAIPLPREPSSHQRCALPQQVARVLAEWRRVHPEWDDPWGDGKPLPLTAPDAQAIAAGLERR